MLLLWLPSQAPEQTLQPPGLEAAARGGDLDCGRAGVGGLRACVRAGQPSLPFRGQSTLPCFTRFPPV